MSAEEKRAWIMGVVTVVAYVVYVVTILGRAGPVPLVDVPYVAMLFWTIGGAIVAAIVLGIVFSMFSPRDAQLKDERDREIGRFGDHVGNSFVVIGAVTALGLAMAEANHFWIANAVYLAFVLSSILGSTAKIAAYRWGFQKW